MDSECPYGTAIWRCGGRARIRTRVAGLEGQHDIRYTTHPVKRRRLPFVNPLVDESECLPYRRKRNPEIFRNVFQLFPFDFESVLEL